MIPRARRAVASVKTDPVGPVDTIVLDCAIAFRVVRVPAAAEAAQRLHRTSTFSQHADQQARDYWWRRGWWKCPCGAIFRALDRCRLWNDEGLSAAEADDAVFDSQLKELAEDYAEEHGGYAAGRGATQAGDLQRNWSRASAEVFAYANTKQIGAMSGHPDTLAKR